MFSRSFLKGIQCILILGLMGMPVTAADTLVVAKKILFGKSARVGTKVREQCQIEERLAEDLARSALSVYENTVNKKPASGDYHVLEVDIVSLHGPGGGVFSGPKNLELSGRLLDSKGKELGSFRVERSSMGGIGGLGGTCKIFRKLTRVLADDVASWLRDPKPNTRIER